MNFDGFDLAHMDIKITVNDLVKIFKTFAGSYSKNTRLMDKVMGKMVKYLHGMSNK